MTTTTKLDRTDSAAVLTSMMTGNRYDAAKVDVNVNWVGGTGKKIDATIHATAVACIHLSMPHVDGGHNCAIRATRLLNKMPKGSRAKTLVRWFAEYSNVRLSYDKKAGHYTGGVLKPTDKLYREARPVAANATPFWSEAESVPQGAFNDERFVDAVENLIKRAMSEKSMLTPAMKAKVADLRNLGIVKLPNPAGNVEAFGPPAPDASADVDPLTLVDA